MLIKNIEQKIKLVRFITILTFSFAFLVVVAALVFTYLKIREERQQIYVLNNGIPTLVNRRDMAYNRKAEYYASIDLFHNLFYTLPPDDEYIQESLDKALYLVDDSGLKEYNTLKEKGYYSQILATSSVVSLKTDSIHINEAEKRFVYYGKERIERKTSVSYRKLETVGSYKDVPRTINNPHGVLIMDWKIEKNDDISSHEKRDM